MQKRIFTLIAALLVLCVFLAACGGGSSDGGDGRDGGNGGEEANAGADASAITLPTPTEVPLVPYTGIDYGGKPVTFAAWWELEENGLGRKRGESEAGDLAVDRVEEMEIKYNFVFETEDIPGGGTEFAGVMSASVMANAPRADFFYLQAMFQINHAARGVTYPLDKIDAFDFTNAKWNKGVKDFSTFNGNIYGMSPSISPRNCLIFNKSLLDRLGLDAPYDLQRSMRWDWDRFLDYAIKTTRDRTEGEYGLAGNHLHLPILTSNEAGYLRFEGGRPVVGFGDQAALEALEFYNRLFEKEGVIYREADGRFVDLQFRTPFTEGKIGFWSADQYNSAILNGSDSDADIMPDDFGILAFPMGPSASQYYSACGDYTIWNMPSNVADAEIKAAIFNIWTNPLPIVTPDSWRDSLVNAVRDEESIESVGILRENMIINSALLIGDFANAFFYGHAALARGDVTPQSYYDQNNERAQTMLDEHYASWQ